MMRFAIVLGAALLAGCGMFANASPARAAADALRAEDVAHEAAQAACDAYETALASKLVRGDSAVTGACAARKP